MALLIFLTTSTWAKHSGFLGVLGSILWLFWAIECTWELPTAHGNLLSGYLKRYLKYFFNAFSQFFSKSYFLIIYNTIPKDCHVFYSTLTPLLSSFLHKMLIVKMIIIYNKDDTIAKVLKAFTSILIVVVLNSSITVESNIP